MQKLNLSQSLVPTMERGRVLSSPGLIIGQHHCQLFNKYGELKNDFIAKNSITNQGKNTLLDAYFNGGAFYTTWFAGIVDNANFVQTLPGDTALSHTGWTEFLSYKTPDNILTSRIVWGQGLASSQQVTNINQMIFTFTASGVTQGIFLISSGGKDGWEDSFLWSTALFTATLPVEVDDVLRISYTISL